MPQWNHRTSLKRLVDVLKNLTEEQKEVVKSMGFGGMIKFEVKSVDKNLILSLADCFDPVSRSILIHGKKIEVNSNLVQKNFGIPCGKKNFLMTSSVQ